MLGDTTLLNIPDNYRFLNLDINVGETRMGPDALRQSFETLYKCQGEKSRDLRCAIGIFVVHISEAARIKCVYKVECMFFLTYDSRKPIWVEKNSHWVTNYGHYCTEIMEDIENWHDGIATPRIKDREGALVRSSGEVFKEIRIVLLDSCSEGANEEKPPMIEDPNDHHNKMRLAERLKAGNKRPRMKQESRGRSKKPQLDEISDGDGDGGSPLIGYLLEDLHLKVDKERKATKKEANEEEKEMKEAMEEEDEIEEVLDEEEIKEEVGGEQKEQ
jgi:hypothetical protein